MASKTTNRRSRLFGIRKKPGRPTMPKVIVKPVAVLLNLHQEERIK